MRVFKGATCTCIFSASSIGDPFVADTDAFKFGGVGPVAAVFGVNTGARADSVLREDGTCHVIALPSPSFPSPLSPSSPLSFSPVTPASPLAGA